jgi:AcrR family transcriptional regulator
MTANPTREAVIRATLARMEQYNSLTTAQIAEAAGVEEADLLRVFAGKEAIFQACTAYLASAMVTLVDRHQVLRDITAIPVAEPLAGRLVAVVDALDRDTDRHEAAYEAMMHPPASVAVDIAPADQFDETVPREDLLPTSVRAEVRRAVADLLAPERDHLRLPAETLADLFLRLSFFARMGRRDRPRLPAEQLVDLFLHGALTAADAQR